MKLVEAGLLAAVLLLAPGGRAPNDSEVRWRGKMLSIDELAARAGKSPATCARNWEKWAADNGYRFELDEAARVLILLPKDEKLPTRRRKLVDRTVQFIGSLLPLPLPGKGEGDDVERKSRPPRVIEAVTLLQLGNRKDFKSCVARLGRDYTYIAEWAAAMEPYSSFFVEKPPCTGWTEKEQGQEHYDPENLAANYLSGLLIKSRFGRLPHWIEMGFAWHFEFELTGNLGAYPFRQNVLARVPNQGWDTDLRRDFKKHDGPLPLEDLVGWEGDQFDEKAAPLAWGLVRFLVANHPQDLPTALDRLAALCRVKGGRNAPDRGWVWNEPSAKEQRVILEEVFGPGVLNRAAEAFRRR